MCRTTSQQARHVPGALPSTRARTVVVASCCHHSHGCLVCTVVARGSHGLHNFALCILASLPAATLFLQHVSMSHRRAARRTGNVRPWRRIAPEKSSSAHTTVCGVFFGFSTCRSVRASSSSEHGRHFCATIHDASEVTICPVHLCVRTRSALSLLGDGPLGAHMTV